MNLTRTCLPFHPNNAVRLENGKVAAELKGEFSEQ